MPTLQQVVNSDNLIETIMTAGQLAGFTVSHIDKFLSNGGHQRVLIGPDDSGQTFDIDALIAARNGNHNIIFMHSDPSPTVRAVDGETREEWDARQADYLQKLYDNFGVEQFVDGEPYYFYTQAKIITNNPVLPLNTLFTVAETHSYRLALRSTVTIYANDPLRVNGPTNWYVARLAGSGGKGDVWFFNAGHLGYGKNALTALAQTEKDFIVYGLT